MPTIISTQIFESTPRGDGTNYVRIRYTLDTGAMIDDGPRFLPQATDLTAYAAAQGVAILEAIANAEVEQWLSS